MIVQSIRPQQRSPVSAQSPQVRPRSPAVMEFLNRFDATEEELSELRSLLERRETDVAVRDQRIVHLENELRRVTGLKETFQRGFHAIYEQMQIFARGAIGCIEVTNKQMIREGVADQPAKPDPLDEGASKIGQRHGSGFGETPRD